jgi:two-component system, cell cycle response regulator
VTAELTPSQRRLVRLGAALLLTAFAAFVLYTATGLGGATGKVVFGDWIYCAVMLGAAASCLLRARLIAAERGAWTLLGLALLAWTAGEIYFSADLAGQAQIPAPSPADIGYLAFYPLAYAGVIALVRRRIDGFGSRLLLDGVIVAAAAAALAATFALGPIVDAGTEAGHTAFAEVVNVAYPIGDLALLALVVATAAFDRWRLGTRWMLLGAALLVLAISDGTYLLLAAEGNYVEGGLLDNLWPLGALMLAGAAWLRPPRAEAVDANEGGGMRQVLVPVAGALIVIGIEAAEHFTKIETAAMAFATLTLIAVVLRMAIAFRDSQTSLDKSTRQALTDPLTGLGNRRRLMADLEAATTRRRAAGESCLMVVFDLDGFKTYNDAFGRPAGDVLLRRLGRRLEAFVDGRGDAYRLGGDEFCLLAECSAGEVDGLVAGAAASLGERGDGFLVTAAQGSVLIPAEAATRDAALALADRRMYASKRREAVAGGNEICDVLLAALREREPDLHEHICGTASLAVAVADELGVGAEERDEIYRAAELHDVGKMAIPDAILDKPGPLDPAEWDFIRKHTLIGERIIAAAPALVPIARLVRSSHERWDGGGYPDGLAGEAIPLGSRIVNACDAFDAMLSVRSYKEAMGTEEALAELDRGAGPHFDPLVAAALRRVVERVPAARR